MHILFLISLLVVPHLQLHSNITVLLEDLLHLQNYLVPNSPEYYPQTKFLGGDSFKHDFYDIIVRIQTDTSRSNLLLPRYFRLQQRITNIQTTISTKGFLWYHRYFSGICPAKILATRRGIGSQRKVYSTACLPILICSRGYVDVECRQTVQIYAGVDDSISKIKNSDLVNSSRAERSNLKIS